MIDLNTTNEWQHRCPETGLVLPWYTKSFLDELVTWDLKDKVVFEYGCGASTLWWAANARLVYAVESDPDWHAAVTETYPNNCVVARPLDLKDYVGSIKHMHDGFFDIIVIDGIRRDECVPIALRSLNPKGVLIFDNWMQPSVEVQREETQRLLLALPHKIYKQTGHPDWQTLVVWNNS